MDILLGCTGRPDMVASFGNALKPWLESLQPMLAIDWELLTSLDSELEILLADHPIDPTSTPGRERSRRLMRIRSALARHERFALVDAVAQVMVQFACGYIDIDLRDAVGPGHGALIARHGSAAVRDRWLPRLKAGELAGIAITEKHGGSQPAAMRTQARVAADGTWLISGCKTWISRLTEAAVFVVFFRSPNGCLAAATVDATNPGLCRRPVPPAGLAGWSWGVLELDAVRVRPNDVLIGDGMQLLRQHFAGYRPLVTATALGGAAAVFDTVTQVLAARRAAGDVVRLRDSALVTVGRAHVQITTALLGTVLAAQLARTSHADAELWGAATKAHGIDIANQTAAELALLVGAAGFRADSRVAKVRRDLNGLLYADGIHDSLYRAAGKHHTASELDIPAPRDVPEQPGSDYAPTLLAQHGHTFVNSR